MADTTFDGGDGPTVVLIHGFTQNSRCWAPLDESLAEDHDVLAVDLPGHGTRGDLVADLPATADLLAHQITDHLSSASRPPSAVVVGYSLGGRVALHLALTHPWLVERLVLIGATPGIEDPDERAERRSADEAQAALVRRIGVPAFLDGWLALPLFAGLDDRTAHRHAREANTAEGLASSLLHCGTGTQEPLWDRLSTLEMPTLLVTGASDRKFSGIADRMVDAIGRNATHMCVPGVGHTVHLEAPLQFWSGLREWIDQTP